MLLAQTLQPSDLAVLTTIFLVVAKVILTLRKRSKTGTTRLKGPKSTSFIFGFYRYIQEQDEPGLLYEKWAEEYGPAFIVPGPFGSQRIVIYDTRATGHFYSRETFGYVQTKLARVFVENLFGRGVLWAEGESHKRQRKALTPAFSNAAIRQLSTVFYDSAYKMKDAWDSIMESEKTGYALIDVQKWMNHISLDSIGIAGFGHDFGALSGNNTPVVDVFESFSGANTDFISRLIFFLGPVFPTLQNLPTRSNLMLRQLKNTMAGIADELLKRSRRAGDGKANSDIADKSIIGLLVKSENAGTQLQMSSEEVLAQMNILLLAGLETTSISLTWALIELSRNPKKQQILREEIAGLGGADPSWEQLTSELPYLDAVVHEILRLHPPVSETTRVAAENDIIPFSRPITTANGTTTDKLIVAKGTVISAPISTLNRSDALWGSDAKHFEPERWLDGRSERAKGIQGHRHILTFSDGPRICLGKNFALAEFKIVLAVMIRHYAFEFPDGPNTRIKKHPSFLPRPKIEGCGGPQVPLRVLRVDIN